MQPVEAFVLKAARQAPLNYALPKVDARDS